MGLSRPTRGTRSSKGNVIELVIVWLSLPTGGLAYCSVATIYGLNTADCNNKSFETIPVTLRDDIKVLKFNDNQLVTVSNDAFRPYPMLRELYLVRNRIQTIATEAFRGLYSLQVLDLEGNALVEIPTGSLHNLQALKTLSLAANPIRDVPENSLRPLLSIEQLNFENCLIGSFDSKALGDLTQLTELNLVSNELTGLDASMTEFLPPSLSFIRLHRNPWTCDCKLRWLRKRVETMTWEFGRDSPTCAGPDLLRGIFWNHLSPNQFACPSQIIASGPTALEVKPGANITVECLVSGDPEPAVWWTQGSKAFDKGRTARNYLWTLSKEQRILSTLFITDANPSHAGHYKCIAENSAGRSETTYRLWMAGAGDGAAAATGRRDLVELTLGQRVVIGVSVGLACVLFVVVSLVGLLVSQRHRWMNSYKVTDSISHSNCYSNSGDSIDEKPVPLPTPSTATTSPSQPQSTTTVGEGGARSTDRMGDRAAVNKQKVQSTDHHQQPQQPHRSPFGKMERDEDAKANGDTPGQTPTIDHNIIGEEPPPPPPPTKRVQIHFDRRRKLTTATAVDPSSANDGGSHVKTNGRTREGGTGGSSSLAPAPRVGLPSSADRSSSSRELGRRMRGQNGTGHVTGNKDSDTDRGTTTTMSHQKTFRMKIFAA